MSDEKDGDIHDLREEIERLQAAVGHLYLAIDAVSKLAFDVPKMTAEKLAGLEFNQDLMEIIKRDAGVLQNALRSAHPLIWSKTK